MTEFNVENVTKVEEPKRSDWWVTENIRTTPERTASVNRLIDMLTYKRVAWSKTERKFIHEYLKPIKGMKFDKFGNMSVRCGELPILWSSHTDTVHEKKGKQVVGFDKNEVGIAAEDNTGSQCLGADDTAGVWLMLEMMEAGVPGLYVFHREEEGGRKGSKWIVENNKELLAGIQYAIALDRRNTGNLITHQMGSRCCSEDWGNQLAKLLNKSGKLDYKLDSTGSYTDTASYTDHIGECTNLSVGYTGAHTKWERLDLEYIFKLRDVLCSPEFIAGLTQMEPKRQPGEKEVYQPYVYKGSGSYYNSANEKRSYGGHAWTKEEREFWEEWDYNGGSGTYGSPNGHSAFNGQPFRGHNGHGNNGYGFVKRHDKGTQTGTQVGTGANESKIRNVLLNGASESNPDGTAVIMLPGPKGKEVELPLVQPAVKKPDDDDSEHDTNYERLIQLIQRNPEATMELLSQIVDDSPETIADILDAEGMTEKKFMDEILDMYGVVNC